MGLMAGNEQTTTLWGKGAKEQMYVTCPLCMIMCACVHVAA